jgi:murein L,D-transpeptidase YcbB/YkuD
MMLIIVSHDRGHIRKTGDSLSLLVNCLDMKFRSIPCLFFFAVILLLFSCKATTNLVAVDPIHPVTQSGSVVSKTQQPLLIPEDSLSPVFNGLARKESVIKYYQRYGRTPVWIQDWKYSALADSMIYILQHVEYYGFPKGGYHLAELVSIRSNFTRDGLIRKEILLTDAFFSLSENLRFGIRNSQWVTGDSLRIELLNSVLASRDVKKILESQEPFVKGYTSLKEGLRLMLDSAKAWPVDSMSLKKNIRLISVNLERWRAENVMIGNTRYILINIPSFNLDVVENDSIVLSSKVIVGTPEKETPVLSSVVECFSIYPYWHVPRKISTEEYLPVIKKDSTFITRNNFDVLDRKGNILNPDSVKWNRFNGDYFPVVLRQREGPENSLGIIKFIFDNPYAVFLHDTNAKSLFRSKTRAFSHGCIRMERAVDLAHFLVTGVAGKKSKYISKYLAEKTQHWIDLRNPIPIHVRYFTCEFKGNTFFSYKDVYGKDMVLYELLFGDDNSLDLRM